MIKAELTCNPYLQEIDVKFNGHPPRINSLIEKYQENRLQDWISKIPAIFYDEMNGYHFELEFSGTSLDFQDLQNAFTSQGINLEQEEVLLTHNKKLADRADKTAQIANILAWLNANPNRKFDFKQFQHQNNELLDTTYPLVVIGDESKGSADLDLAPIDGINVSVEVVRSVEELQDTNLTNTPIVLCYQALSQEAFQSTLLALLSRADVTQRQLFLLATTSADQAGRIAMDLGVRSPQLVNDLHDPSLAWYFRVYPITDYITGCIKVFRTQYNDLKDDLDAERYEQELANQDVYAQLQRLDKELFYLKRAHQQLNEYGTLELQNEWQAQKSACISKIKSWMSRETKTTKPEVARQRATNLDELTRYAYQEFERHLSAAVTNTQLALTSNLRQCYERAEFDTIFRATAPLDAEPKAEPIGYFMESLMDDNEQAYVTPKTEFSITMFGREFGNTPKEENVLVLEKTWHYQKWRNYAFSLVEPKIDQLLKAQLERISVYYETLKTAYIVHVEELIARQSAEREAVSSQLSAEEQLLQTDQAWLDKLGTQLDTLERG